jgi:hypothetical protein
VYDILSEAGPGRFDWEATLAVPALAGMGNEDLRQDARFLGEVAPGVFKVIFRCDRELPIPSGCVESLHGFLQDEERICAAVLDAILTAYPKERAKMLKWCEESELPDLPSASTLDELRPMIAFYSLYVHESRDGLADLGFGFSCQWDIEHGAGVRWLDDRVVCIGNSEIAFDEFEKVKLVIDNLGDRRK